MDSGSGSTYASGNEGAGPSGVAGGGTDLAVAKNRVKEIEKVLIVLQCTEEQRVLFVTYKLAREVKRWWNAVKLLEQQRTILSSLVQRRQDRGVLEPEVETVDSATVCGKVYSIISLCPYIIPNEIKKVRQFKIGPRQEFHKQVSILKLQDFIKLVDKATMVEAGERLEPEEQKHRKRFTPSGS
ncbi:uncharacterized protein LOC131148224 [Malania oleifera]|uniref:uncharacterized protein LOC131148224 n=1 Tax=Malania oleifera TaxID=397392 RepID=UPI0025AE231C|nr:uncharacterized protein LOC131148224 [Malania oleifera]